MSGNGLKRAENRAASVRLPVNSPSFFMFQACFTPEKHHLRLKTDRLLGKTFRGKIHILVKMRRLYNEAKVKNALRFGGAVVFHEIFSFASRLKVVVVALQTVFGYVPADGAHGLNTKNRIQGHTLYAIFKAKIFCRYADGVGGFIFFGKHGKAPRFYVHPRLMQAVFSYSVLPN
jgi:hypothetical protein